MANKTLEIDAPRSGSLFLNPQFYVRLVAPQLLRCYEMITHKVKSTFRSKVFTCRFLLAASFSILCVAFVPVAILLGWYSTVAPLSLLFMSFVVGTAESWTLWKICYIVVYIGVFFGLGFLASSVICSRTNGRLRVLLSSILLVIPVATTFLPVLTYYGPRGGGGTYTFWTASVRYFEVYSDVKSAANREAEQGVAPQSATRAESEPEGSDKPQPETEARSR